MEIIIKEDNLTVSHKLEPEWPNEVSPAEAMIAAYDVLSQIFGQKAVIDAYYRTDPDTMAVRDEDDDFFKHVKFFGYNGPRRGLKEPRNARELAKNHHEESPRSFCFLDFRRL